MITMSKLLKRLLMSGTDTKEEYDVLEMKISVLVISLALLICGVVIGVRDSGEILKGIAMGIPGIVIVSLFIKDHLHNKRLQS